jgi:hypothetical protein
MLGRRNPQRSFFEAQSLPHRVAPDSFYGRMGAVSETLFCDDDLAEMYCADNGRPSLPPSLLSGVTLLQFYDDVSDSEAVARTLYDLRWKVALNLPLDFAGFDPSSLSVFRARLVEHGQERYAFNRFVAVGRAAGFLPDKVTLLVDTTPVAGAGAVQDTYTLLRKGVRRLLKAMGFHLPSKRQGMAAPTRALVATYLDQDRKADIDWADPAQRAAQLKVLVEDVESTLELASEHADDAEVRTLGWVLTKILGDDVDSDEGGQPRIAQGTAPDRIISMTELDMRHGRKSAARRFDGFKVAAGMEPESELLLDVADMPASSGDGNHLLPTIRRVEAQSGLDVERAMGDGAYNSGDNLVACATHALHPIDLVVPFKRPADPDVDKSAFSIDLAARTIRCPQGHRVTGQPARDGQGRAILKFTFPRCVCATCPLFEACVHSRSTGRSVTTHAYEAELQVARARQESEEFKTLYPTRSKVERKIAELAYHGIRHTRYLGEPKRQLQRAWTGAAVNLKRLFHLAQDRGVDLAMVLATLAPSQEARMGV